MSFFCLTYKTYGVRKPHAKIILFDSNFYLRLLLPTLYSRIRRHFFDGSAEFHTTFFAAAIPSVHLDPVFHRTVDFLAHPFADGIGVHSRELLYGIEIAAGD